MRERGKITFIAIIAFLSHLLRIHNAYGAPSVLDLAEANHIWIVIILFRFN